MALLLLALLPLAFPWGLVCFGGLAVFLFTWAFSCIGLPRMGGLLVASGFWHSDPGVAPGNVTSYWHGCLLGAESVLVRLYRLQIVYLSLRFLL